jgi:hypothetical protein
MIRDDITWKLKGADVVSLTGVHTTSTESSGADILK